MTNEVVLAPGGQVTYRRHQRRHEVWTFTAGEGEMAVEGEMRRVRAGDSVSVAPDERYGCRAETELCVIEVQVGGSVTYEDVERFGYFWG